MEPTTRTVLALPLMVLSAIAARPAGAATYVVDRGDDSAAFTACTAAPQDCTLRGAILAANANPGLDEITFDFTSFLGEIVVLTIPRTGDDSPEEGDLDITDDVAIDGGFQDGVFIVGGGGFNDRIFDVDAAVGAVHFLDLFIMGGEATTLADFCGGGILTSADTFLHRVEVSDNQAHAGGGICMDQNAKLLLDRSSVTGNTAVTLGGGIMFYGGELDLLQSTISGNTSGSLSGAVHVQFLATGPVSLEHVTLTDNSTSHVDGADFYVEGFPSSVEILGSIIDGDCYDPSSLFTSQGGNLEGPGDTCGFDPMIDQIGVADMRLEPLAFGNTDLVLTRCHQPRWNSPAVDDPLGVLAASCPTQDQRFLARPQDGNGDGVAACDSGAVEAQPPIFVDGFESGDTGAWSSTVP
jgi:hypothetical protein